MLNASVEGTDVPRQSPHGHWHVILGDNAKKGIHTTLHTLRLPLNASSIAAAAVIAGSPRRCIPTTFNFVCSGGGLMAFYGGAVASVLGSLHRDGVLKVDQLHGVSCGALVCCCLLSVEANYMKLECVYRCYQLFVQGVWLSYSMRQFLDEFLPPDIHERATGRLHVTVSEFSVGCGMPRRRTVSIFPTRAHLLDTVMASTIIPGLTAPRMHRPKGGLNVWWMDGGTVNSPSPTNGHTPCLMLDLMQIRKELQYPLRWIIQTVDDDFDANLCLPALKHVTRFLGQGESGRNRGMRFAYR